MVVTLGNLTADPNNSSSTGIGLVASPYTGVNGNDIISKFVAYQRVRLTAGKTAPGEKTYEIIFDDNITGSYNIQIYSSIMRKSYYYEIYLE